MIIPSQNQHLAQQYFETLPLSDINRKYYDENEQYTVQKPGFLNIVTAWLSMQHDSRLDTLSKFYPYQKTIQATKQEYEEQNLINYYNYQSLYEKQYLFNRDQSYCYQKSAVQSLVLSAVLFQCAKRNYVFPLFNEYGRFFKTHRLFRQYVAALCLPVLLNEYALTSKYFVHLEHCWKIHSKRLNQKLLKDPDFTYYPKNTRPAFKNFI